MSNRGKISNSDSFQLVSPPISKRIRSKREHREEKENKKRLQEEARKEREFQREVTKQKENSRKRGVKPIFVRKVSHKPTYCTVGSYIINKADIPNYESTIPPTFTVKNDIQSSKSLCRLKNAVNWMLLFADKKEVKTKIDKSAPWSKDNIKKWWFRLAFITLTLPDDQQHSDSEIKDHMLQPFLYWLQRYYNCSYVWKAETQINGNIHFHITIDQFVPWKSIRAKWNKIMSNHGYCKIYQDGTNDKGDSATQIKAVLNEKKCAKDIADYVAKKDMLPTVVARGFQSIWKGEVKCTKEIKQCFKYLRYGKEDTEEQMFLTVAAAAATAQLHCAYDPEKKKGNPGLLKRVVDGRLWGTTATTYLKKKNEKGRKVFVLDEFGNKIVDKHGLSNITISIEEGDSYVKETDLLDHEEKIFFRQNPDIYNLGKTLIKRKKIEAAKKSEGERAVLCITDEDIERKYQAFENVWIHPHLSVMKKGSHLQKLIHEQKLKMKFNKQKFFTDN